MQAVYWSDDMKPATEINCTVQNEELFYKIPCLFSTIRLANEQQFLHFT
jgi:hypothetical protein